MSDPFRVCIQGTLKSGSQGKVPLSLFRIEYHGAQTLDPGSGQPVGRRRHEPITITKEVDTISPTLFHAFMTQSMIDTVVIDVVDPAPPGTQCVGSTLSLRDVLVTKITKPVRPRAGQLFVSKVTNELEEVELAFQTITCIGRRVHSS